MKIKALSIVAACAAAMLITSVTEAGYPAYYLSMRTNARTIPWHGAYSDPQWGQPVALVVPPTAEKQTVWSWGVPSASIQPIFPQFRRQYPGPVTPGEWG